MADKTKIADIIVPEVFAPYVIEQINEKSALIKSGIVVPDPVLDKNAQAGGNLVNVPFFKQLTGTDEILSDSNALDPDKITTGTDIARMHFRGKAWGVNDLAKALSGDDPMAAIGSMTADWWNQMEQALLISTLKGVFTDNNANDSADLIHNVALAAGSSEAANLIGAEAIIDAQHKLGDKHDKLTAIIMHSVPYSRLKKNNLIDFVEDSIAKTKIPTYQGLTVIVDDNCPVITSTTPGTIGYISGDADGKPTAGAYYVSYLFGLGAIARGEGSPDYPVETDRDKLAGDDLLIHRRHYVMHPRGIAWQEPASGTFTTDVDPSNTEMESGTYWNRVYTKKNIRLVQLVTNG